jgi:DNA-binding MarR family transcriptional regulator
VLVGSAEYNSYMLLSPELAFREANGWDVISAIRLFSRRLDTRLDDALVDHALSYSGFEVLAQLYERPKTHAGAIGRRLRVSRQSIHGIVHGLERRGAIELMPRGGGRRGALLTEDGRLLLEAAVKASAQVRSTIDAVQPSRAGELLDILDDLDRAFDPKPRRWWLGE